MTVAGIRYGKGSSREHSPVAEFRAGIQAAAASQDPTDALMRILGQALPQVDARALLTRLPAVQEVIAKTLRRF